MQDHDKLWEEGGRMRNWDCLLIVFLTDKFLGWVPVSGSFGVCHPWAREEKYLETNKNAVTNHRSKKPFSLSACSLQSNGISSFWIQFHFADQSLFRVSIADLETFATIVILEEGQIKHMHKIIRNLFWVLRQRNCIHALIKSI